MRKDRLIEAAKAADRSGEVFRIEVLQSGIRVELTRVYFHSDHNPLPRNYTFENFIGWLSIEEAVRNPLLTCLRDLTSQADEFKP